MFNENWRVMMITKEAALEGLDNLFEYSERLYDRPYNVLKQFIEESDKIKKSLELFLDCHEECTDFDGWSAFMVSMDDYHNAAEVLEDDSEEDQNET